jgi:hypothetical protein
MGITLFHVCYACPFEKIKCLYLHVRRAYVCFRKILGLRALAITIDQAAHNRFGWLFVFFSITFSFGFSGTLEIKKTLILVW